MVITHLARRLLLFYELCAYIVGESAGRFIPGTACTFSRSRGFRCRQEYGTEYGIAGGAEWPPGSQEALVPALAACRSQGSPAAVPEPGRGRRLPAVRHGGSAAAAGPAG
jgi:hypothetical protein